MTFGSNWLTENDRGKHPQQKNSFRKDQDGDRSGHDSPDTTPDGLFPDRGVLPYYLAIMILFAGLGMLIIHLSGYIQRKNKMETP